MIRYLEKNDIPDVLTIYQLGIDTGIATFENFRKTTMVNSVYYLIGL